MFWCLTFIYLGLFDFRLLTHTMSFVKFNLIFASTTRAYLHLGKVMYVTARWFLANALMLSEHRELVLSVLLI